MLPRVREVDAVDEERAGVGNGWLAEFDKRLVVLRLPPGAGLFEGGELEHNQPGVVLDVECSLEDVDDGAAQRDVAAVDRVGGRGRPGVAGEGGPAWSWMSMRKAM